MTYNQKGILSTKDKVNQYIPLVRKIAGQVHKKINFMYDIDDLIQSGMVGLLEAIQKPSQTSDKEFESYLSIRIKGSILDELRKNDHLNQEDRKNYNQIHKVSQLFKSQKDNFTDQEIANACQISLDQYYKTIHKNQYYEFLSIDDENFEAKEVVGNDITLEEIEKKEILKKVSKLTSQLNEKEQIVMQLIYVEECNINEIGEILNVSKARISQIHSSCLHKIKMMI